MDDNENVLMHALDHVTTRQSRTLPDEGVYEIDEIIHVRGTVRISRNSDVSTLSGSGNVPDMHIPTVSIRTDISDLSINVAQKMPELAAFEPAAIPK